ncbi:hypothetical protein I3760_01G088300 [Carya illinoinensis]|nr:hypothetical protein I3760_01G088300 [Carya illinoinensis]
MQQSSLGPHSATLQQGQQHMQQQEKEETRCTAAINLQHRKHSDRKIHTSSHADAAAFGQLPKCSNLDRKHTKTDAHAHQLTRHHADHSNTEAHAEKHHQDSSFRTAHDTMQQHHSDMQQTAALTSTCSAENIKTQPAAEDHHGYKRKVFIQQERFGQ